MLKYVRKYLPPPRFQATRSAVLRWIWRAAQTLLLLAVLWSSLVLVAQPDPLGDLRRGDALFAAGRYHDARAAYQRLTRRAPELAVGYVRQGAVEAVRGEHEAASQLLAYAIGLGLHGIDHDIARLYQGRVSAAMGRPDEAEQFWRTIQQASPLWPIRRILEAERLLRAGDYASADAAFQAVDADALPSIWRAVVRDRLLALQAANNPAAARAALGQPVPTSSAVALPREVDTLIVPLRPIVQLDSAALAAALQADPTQQAQLLGQLYLDGGLYALAEAQFTAGAAHSASAQAAAAYTAYTRWLAGDHAGGRAQLEALVAAHPDETRARALLALTHLAERDQANARLQLDAIRAAAPRAPATHLAWAQWYAAQSDYIAATVAYQRAVREAPPEQRGTYLLAQAQFHVATDVQLCETGQPAASEATRLLPEEPRAWITLAAANLRCDDPAAARSAAAQALALDPSDAEAAYYLGRALAALGDRAGARVALVSAADLAPSSPWRQRAEQQLSLLGL